MRHLQSRGGLPWAMSPFQCSFLISDSAVSYLPCYNLNHLSHADSEIFLLSTAILIFVGKKNHIEPNMDWMMQSFSKMLRWSQNIQARCVAAKLKQKMGFHIFRFTSILTINWTKQLKRRCLWCQSSKLVEPICCKNKLLKFFFYPNLKTDLWQQWKIYRCLSQKAFLYLLS